MKAFRLMGALVLLAVSNLAGAASFSYSGGELALSRDRADLVDGGVGYRLSGAFSLGDNLFLEARYQHDEYGHYPVSIPPNARLVAEDRQYRLGAGAHWPMSDSADFVVHLDYSHISPGHSTAPIIFFHPNSKSGYNAGLGIRTWLSPSVEAGIFLDHDNTAYEYQSFFAVTTENVLRANVRWHVASHLVFGVGYESSDVDGQNHMLFTAGCSF